MTGSEKIVARINDNAEKRAAETIVAAEKKADEIIKAADEKANEDKEKIIASANEKAARIGKTAISSAELEKRNVVLFCKRNEIELTLKKAAEHLQTLDDNGYAEFVKRLIEKNALDMEGRIILSPRDTARIKDALGSYISSKGLTVAEDEKRVIDGGFVLVYNDVEINCTISAMIEEKREILEDIINKNLF